MRFLKKIHLRLLYILGRRKWGAARICTICKNKINFFLPYRNGIKGVPPLIQELKIVGSDVDNYLCPSCGSHDRERHLILYMKSFSFFLELQEKKILHIAPEPHISKFIKSLKPLEYIGGDLAPQNPETQRVNIEKTEFPDSYFDIVIANHVLEHVDNEDKALKELFRITKAGGYAILQTPFSSKLTVTFSDVGIDTPKARLHAYGQEDHVRIFGLDIEKKISSAGFISHLSTHKELLPHINAKMYGVNEIEPFFLFEKSINGFDARQ